MVVLDKFCSVQVPYTSVDCYDFSTLTLLVLVTPHDWSNQTKIEIYDFWSTGLSKILDANTFAVIIGIHILVTVLEIFTLTG